MTTTSWTEIKARRAVSDERRHGYERAGRAIHCTRDGDGPGSTQNGPTAKVKFPHDHHSVSSGM